jgi:hypothetical protein
MTWYAWLLIAYIAFDRLLTVAVSGRRPPFTIEVTTGFAVVSLISGSLIIWGIVELAGNAV